jgi:HD-GYP domain-containing protein (c-di-GMP phosphodiesterase class II)
VSVSKSIPERDSPLELKHHFEQYARDLCDLVVQGQSNEEELRAASAQLGVYAADLRRLVLNGQRGNDVMEQACLTLLETLLTFSVRRDEVALRHASATERYAALFARELDMPAAEEARVGRAARLHDIGKVLLPDALLAKRADLDASERGTLRDHCTIGAALAKLLPSRDLQLIGEAIYCHHESWDGSGYPRGLVGDEIPLVARIVKIADVYDTLRDSRSYKSAHSHADACRAILEGNEHVKPEHFDPRLLERFSDQQQWLETLSSHQGSPALRGGAAPEPPG